MHSVLEHMARRMDTLERLVVAQQQSHDLLVKSVSDWRVQREFSTSFVGGGLHGAGQGHDRAGRAEAVKSEITTDKDAAGEEGSDAEAAHEAAGGVFGDEPTQGAPACARTLPLRNRWSII